MKRIKEDEIKEILDFFIYKNLKIQVRGALKLEYFIQNAEIIFSDNHIEFKIRDNKNNIVLNLSYIEEIYFIQKNKLKFLTDNDLEILICIL